MSSTYGEYVWVKQGRMEHHAILLEPLTENMENVRIKWVILGTKAYVPVSMVRTEHQGRGRRRRQSVEQGGYNESNSYNNRNTTKKGSKKRRLNVDNPLLVRSFTSKRRVARQLGNLPKHNRNFDSPSDTPVGQIQSSPQQPSKLVPPKDDMGMDDTKSSPSPIDLIHKHQDTITSTTVTEIEREQSQLTTLVRHQPPTMEIQHRLQNPQNEVHLPQEREAREPEQQQPNASETESSALQPHLQHLESREPEQQQLPVDVFQTQTALLQPQGKEPREVEQAVLNVSHNSPQSEKLLAQPHSLGVNMLKHQLKNRKASHKTAAENDLLPKFLSKQREKLQLERRKVHPQLRKHQLNIGDRKEAHSDTMKSLRQELRLRNRELLSSGPQQVQQSAPIDATTNILRSGGRQDATFRRTRVDHNTTRTIQIKKKAAALRNTHSDNNLVRGSAKTLPIPRKDLSRVSLSKETQMVRDVDSPNLVVRSKGSKEPFRSLGSAKKPTDSGFFKTSQSESRLIRARGFDESLFHLRSTEIPHASRSYDNAMMKASDAETNKISICAKGSKEPFRPLGEPKHNGFHSNGKTRSETTHHSRDKSQLFSSYFANHEDNSINNQTQKQVTFERDDIHTLRLPQTLANRSTSTEPQRLDQSLACAFQSSKRSCGNTHGNINLDLEAKATSTTATPSKKQNGQSEIINHGSIQYPLGSSFSATTTKSSVELLIAGSSMQSSEVVAPSSNTASLPGKPKGWSVRKRKPPSLRSAPNSQVTAPDTATADGSEIEFEPHMQEDVEDVSETGNLGEKSPSAGVSGAFRKSGTHTCNTGNFALAQQPSQNNGSGDLESLVAACAGILWRQQPEDGQRPSNSSKAEMARNVELPPDNFAPLLPRDEWECDFRTSEKLTCEEGSIPASTLWNVKSRSSAPRSGRVEMREEQGKHPHKKQRVLNSIIRKLTMKPSAYVSTPLSPQQTKGSRESGVARSHQTEPRKICCHINDKADSIPAATPDDKKKKVSHAGKEPIAQNGNPGNVSNSNQNEKHVVTIGKASEDISNDTDVVNTELHYFTKSITNYAKNPKKRIIARMLEE